MQMDDPVFTFDLRPSTRPLGLDPMIVTASFNNATGCLRCKCASTARRFATRYVPWDRVERRPGTP